MKIHAPKAAKRGQRHSTPRIPQDAAKDQGFRVTPIYRCLIDLADKNAAHPGPQAADWITAARRDSPTRRVKRSGKHGSFRYPSLKMGFAIDCEGSIERLFCVEAEFDSRVARFYPQPPSVPLCYARTDGRGIRTNYTPDFLVEFVDGRVAVVECKPVEVFVGRIQIQDPRASFDPQTERYSDPVARSEFERLGLAHSVLLDIDANPTLVRNLDFLGRDHFKAVVNSTTVPQLIDAVSRRCAVPLSELLDPTNVWTSTDVYTAIAQGKLWCDLTSDRLDAGCATPPFSRANAARHLRRMEHLVGRHRHRRDA